MSFENVLIARLLGAKGEELRAIMAREDAEDLKRHREERAKTHFFKVKVHIAITLDKELEVKLPSDEYADNPSRDQLEDGVLTDVFTPDKAWQVIEQIIEHPSELDDKTCRHINDLRDWDVLYRDIEFLDDNGNPIEDDAEIGYEETFD